MKNTLLLISILFATSCFAQNKSETNYQTEKTLIRIEGNAGIFGGALTKGAFFMYLNKGFGIAVEQKTNSSFSIIGGFNHNLLSNIQFELTESIFSLGSHYYYTQAKRIRLGETANNFSNNCYIGILGKYSATTPIKKDLFDIQLTHGRVYRFGKWGFYDASYGLEFGNRYNYQVQNVFNPVLFWKISAGIGL